MNWLKGKLTSNHKGKSINFSRNSTDTNTFCTNLNLNLICVEMILLKLCLFFVCPFSAKRKLDYIYRNQRYLYRTKEPIMSAEAKTFQRYTNDYDSDVSSFDGKYEKRIKTEGKPLILKSERVILASFMYHSIYIHLIFTRLSMLLSEHKHMMDS